MSFDEHTTGPRDPDSGPLDALDQGRFTPGEIFAERYRIVGLLGRGGMGEVYRADDLTLRQPVALKLLRGSAADNPKRANRFPDEVRVARQVTHGNVCRVHDIGVADGQPFLSMEYVDGENLGSLLARIGRLSQDKAVELVRQICAGLAAAHERGVLHRDLKPANVMIDGRGKAVITDFGLAGFAGDEEASDVVAGTPAYMSPEQTEGRETTARSDLYALGLILYEMVAGRPAFRAFSRADLLRMQREVAPPRPSSLVQDLDPALDRLILSCLEKDPVLRPASALAVAQALPSPADTLAALVAAGRTPSPEAVAAAGDAVGMRPRLAWICLALVLVSLPASLQLTSSLILFRQIPFDKPPDVLEERGHAILARLGVDPSGAHRAHGFAYDRGLVEYLTDHGPAQNRWQALDVGQPAAVEFWYRSSPRPLEAANALGRVSLQDPAPLLPGMASVRLDTRGRLIELSRVPALRTRADAEAGGTDWSGLLAEAGLTPADLKVVEPEWPPPVHADERVAWEGRLPDAPQYPVRIEAAAYRGTPVAFRILGPWSHPASDAAASFGVPPPFFAVLGFVVMLAAAGGAATNLILGRGERRGAARLGALVFVVRLVVWILETPHTADLWREWVLFQGGLAAALVWAAWAWAFYMAIEPYVRRHWPQSLISWTRLLSGRLSDPLVGRDLLLGLALGLVGNVILGLGRVGPTWLGAPAAHPLYLDDLDALLGVRFVPVAILHGALKGLTDALVLLVLLALGRALLRQRWVAFAAVWLLASVFGVLTFGTGHALNALSVGVFLALALGVLTRFGFLPLVALFLPHEVSPLTPHLTAWYGASTAAWLVVMLGVAVFGFRASMAGQPLVSRSFLDA